MLASRGAAAAVMRSSRVPSKGDRFRNERLRLLVKAVSDPSGIYHAILADSFHRRPSGWWIFTLTPGAPGLGKSAGVRFVTVCRAGRAGKRDRHGLPDHRIIAGIARS